MPYTEAQRDRAERDARTLQAVGAFLRQWSINIGIPIKEAGESIGVSDRYIYQFTGGHAHVGYLRMFEFITALRADVRDVLQVILEGMTDEDARAFANERWQAGRAATVNRDRAARLKQAISEASPDELMRLLRAASDQAGDQDDPLPSSAAPQRR